VLCSASPRSALLLLVFYCDPVGGIQRIQREDEGDAEELERPTRPANTAKKGVPRAEPRHVKAQSKAKVVHVVLVVFGAACDRAVTITRCCLCAEQVEQAHVDDDEDEMGDGHNDAEPNQVPCLCSALPCALPFCAVLCCALLYCGLRLRSALVCFSFTV